MIENINVRVHCSIRSCETRYLSADRIIDILTRVEIQFLFVKSWIFVEIHHFSRIDIPSMINFLSRSRSPCPVLDHEHDMIVIILRSWPMIRRLQNDESNFRWNTDVSTRTLKVYFASLCYSMKFQSYIKRLSSVTSFNSWMIMLSDWKNFPTIFLLSKKKIKKLKKNSTDWIRSFVVRREYWYDSKMIAWSPSALQKK